MPFAQQNARRDLWLARLYYWLFLGGGGFILPFLNLFYVRVGLTGTDIGLVAAVASLIGLVTAPVWASESRKRENPRGLLQLALLLTAISYLGLGFQAAFWGIVLLTAARALVSSGVSPLSDALTLSVTKGSKVGFGSVRVWASAGWIVSALVSGWLIERTGFGTAFAGIFLLTCAGALILFPVAPHHFSRVKPGQKAIGLKTILRRLQHNPTMVALALTVGLTGLMNNGVLQFETVYLNQLGAKEALLGVAGVMSACVEIPCMLWADRLVRKRGARPIFLMALLLNVALRIVILLVPSIPTIMIVRAIGGISFSFYTVALIGFISEQCEPQETGTVLAVYTVTLVNLISIIAAPLAGAAYDAWGPRYLYAFAAVGYAIGWSILRLARQPKPALALKKIGGTTG